MKSSIIYFLLMGCIAAGCTQAKNLSSNKTNIAEQHRPAIHFTPASGWMNDPNGMFFYNGTYHLFYQYYPDSTVWGPMHWGHATSKNLVHWQHQPIALYPDSLGYIFSGSAVVDSANTSGFGTAGKVPIVAVYTQHDPVGEKKGRNDFQYQSIAYSLDEGRTWTKYAGNPVLQNPGIRDFRDPKVTWYAATQKWIMTLACGDHIEFYSSPDLKTWSKESEFGKTLGAHGGVWECPDLFPLQHNGQTVWVLLVSINPGGPNGGSATQYFTGNFDGHNFTTTQRGTKWIDYGPDNYAGVTWSNTGDRKLFMGWMSNWQYAQVVPTKTWRSAMTVPRELKLMQIANDYYISSAPVTELSLLAQKPAAFTNITENNFSLTSKTGLFQGPARLHLATKNSSSFSITFSNTQGQQVKVGFDSAKNEYYMDRTRSGKVAFEKGFAAVHTAPRLATTANLNLTLIIDKSSIELFAVDGTTIMTQLFFPDEDFTTITVNGDRNVFSAITFTPLRPAH